MNFLPRSRIFTQELKEMFFGWQLAESDLNALLEARKKEAHALARREELRAQAECLRGLSAFHDLKETFSSRSFSLCSCRCPHTQIKHTERERDAQPYFCMRRLAANEYVSLAKDIKAATAMAEALPTKGGKHTAVSRTVKPAIRELSSRSE